MSAVVRALLAELDDAALDELARLLAPRLVAVQTDRSAEGYLAPAAAAEYLGVSRKRIYSLRSSGALEPDGYDGRTPLWSRATLDAYVRRALTRR
jgi:hypothetical protein